MTDLAALHRETAATFTRLVEGVTDWDAPTPVKEWTARGIVEHLTTWLPGLVNQAGELIAPGPSATEDPVGAWKHQTAEVQKLLEDPSKLATPVAMPGAPPQPLSHVLAVFYEPDVFMHTWDLSRATRQDAPMDEQRCEAMFAGMSQIEPMLRASGQFGERVDVAEDASGVDKLMGFIGRDPSWQPA